MNIDNYILNKINIYFQKISLEKHNELFADRSYTYIPTESNFLYEALNIIKNKEIDLRNKKFIDVGSGIGNMCYIATLFEINAEGIELNPILYEISKQIYPEIKFHNVDIRDFNNYDNFDIIFYCVPFNDEILQKELKEKIENNITIGKYIITRGYEEKDDKFISIGRDKLNNRIWQKIKE